MDNTQKLTIGIVVLIVVVLALNVFFVWGLKITGPQQPNLPPGQSPSNAPKTEFVSIISNNCPDCIELAGLIEQLKQLDLNFSERELVFETDSEAQSLVQKYNIQKLPVLIIKANPTDFVSLEQRWQALGSSEDGNVLVLRQVPPPYFDVATQSTKGLVELWTISKKECVDCTLSPKKEALEQVGIKISKSNQLDASDSQAQQLIAQYSITKLPVLILSKEIEEYSRLVPVLEAGGDFQTDGAWVLRNPLPYYWDLNQNRSVGSLFLIRLTTKSCTQCFDLNVLESFVIQSFGLKIDRNQNMDWSTPEGKKLVADYNISKLPTLLVGGELFAYKGLAENWQRFGFVAPDGKLVFAQHENLGPQYSYFDLDTNSVITPPTQNPSG